MSTKSGTNYLLITSTEKGKVTSILLFFVLSFFRGEFIPVLVVAISLAFAGIFVRNFSEKKWRSEIKLKILSDLSKIATKVLRRGCIDGICIDNDEKELKLLYRELFQSMNLIMVYVRVAYKNDNLLEEFKKEIDQPLKNFLRNLIQGEENKERDGDSYKKYSSLNELINAVDYWEQRLAKAEIPLRDVLSAKEGEKNV